MRLLYLVADAGVPACGPSGASVHVREITRAIQDRGHEVRLVSARDRDARGEVECPQVPFEVAGVGSWPSWLRRWDWMKEVRTARRVARVARREAPAQAVLERYSLFSDAGRIVSRRLGVPWIVEVNAPLAQERARYGQGRPTDLTDAWERRVLRGATHVTAVSRWLVRWLVEHVGCSPERVHYIPNGTVDIAGDRANARARLQIPQDAFVLGYLGSFRPWHGVDTLVPILRRIPDARLLLVGADTDHRFPVPEEREMADRIVATGPVVQAQVPHLVAAMDVGLAPYPAEAPPWFCPLKVLDYRAQGTPVVATDVGDCRELVAGAGTVVSSGDPDALAAAVEGWRGRRTEPHVRAWSRVARETLALLTDPPRPPRLTSASGPTRP